MKKLICIVGETARGKDTLADILNIEYGYRKVVSYTTRPKRKIETEGVEHYFINKFEAQRLKKWSKIVAHTTIGLYEYFATADELNRSDIYIIDPAGLVDLASSIEQKGLDIELFIVYITCSDFIRNERAIKRGDDESMLKNRIISEKNMFEEFDKSGLYDLKYVNDGSLNDLKIFAAEIHGQISGQLWFCGQIFLGFVHKNGCIVDKTVDKMDKKVAKWPIIFEKWPRWNPVFMRVCGFFGQKPTFFSYLMWNKN